MEKQQQRFRIGRSRECDVVLADDSISRVHAELTIVGGDKLFITDCHSRNGTMLLKEGREVAIHQDFLFPEDVVRFGDVELSVKEILKAVKERHELLDIKSPVPPPPSPQDKKPWVRGARLIRCSCGHVKEKGKYCAECGK
ncbi:MAG: FHA domain-containing protein [Desulfovibrio sp.]|nr:MAG: FHA domain-containing protein [Desulfovibrio sp.]